MYTCMEIYNHGIYVPVCERELSFLDITDINDNIRHEVIFKLLKAVSH